MNDGEETKRRRWISLIKFLVVAMITMGAILYVAETYFPSSSSDLGPARLDRISRRLFDMSPWLYRSAQKIFPAEPPAIGDTLKLIKDQAYPLGKNLIIYRGIYSGDTFQIDVIIPEFDPNVAYPYRLTIDQCKGGFRLADHWVQLISVKRNLLTIQL